ncbi:hypothetical protein [Paracoccus xiamenensis]|uniref:hypothetical protein n=1 Tax=Paracoccus xiamenensis TaxID=2714901 RepID=UPI00140B2CC2|nr:hypothetical protein [Paracoccus xiamenensis]NHF73958.1 hypothetical protein [Paracoccus xiamenensis]
MRKLFALTLILLAGCVPEKSAPVDDPRTAGMMSAAERAECRAAGGNVVQGLGPQVCATPTPDAGKTCRSGSECSGGTCLADDTRANGQCAPSSVTFGCISVLEDGQKVMICID